MQTQFKFRLERLLGLRDRNVQDCRIRLAKSINAVLEAQAELHCLQKERQDLSEAWQQALHGGLRADTAQHFQRCFESLGRACELATKKAAKAQTEELACRALLDQALRKQKVLEKLRERMRARFVLESIRREQAQLDEFAVLQQGQEAR